MGLFDKIQKLVQKENYEKAQALLVKKLFTGNEKNISDSLHAVHFLITEVKQRNWQFPDEILAILVKKLKDDYWILRKNTLMAIASVLSQFPDKINEENLFSKIQDIALNDKNWTVRNAALECLSTIVLIVPGRVLKLLQRKTEDPDADVRLKALEILEKIGLDYPDKVKDILPYLVKSMKNDDDFRVSKVAEDAIMKLAEKKKEIIKNKNPNANVYDDVEVKQITCVHCRRLTSLHDKYCDHCGKPLQKDLFSGQIIESPSAVTQCPFCKSYFEEQHIIEWLKKNPHCPNCMEKIDEATLIRPF
ncbi:MAG: HEAT repeat domain-containing protein [Candidatus Helarchaeota archaeon]